MNELELIAALNDAINDSSVYNGELNRVNEKLLQAYDAEPVGDFKAPDTGSSIVSTDVFDVIESDMPSLMRIFTGSGDIIKFMPNTSNEADIKEAEEKTKYINWLVKNQEDSFNIIQDWIKDAEMQKCGVVKFCVEEIEEPETVCYENISQAEIDQVLQTLDGENVSKIEIEKEENEQGLFDVDFTVISKRQEIKIINVPQESFLITRNAKSVKDAELVGDVDLVSRGELLSMGFKRDIVEILPSTETRSKQGNLKSIRNKDDGGYSQEESINDWASELVEVFDLSVRVDFDGDGIAERRHVIMSGNTILLNEQFSLVPYALLTAVKIPHKAIGKSRSEIPYKHQRIQTVLKRGILNNIYKVNHPRHIVHSDVDLDDMLSDRIDGIIRLEDDSEVLPANAITPLVVPYIGDRALQVSQFFDSQRAKSTGGLLANQGLDADKISKETATRFNGVKDDSDAKIELLARNYAETGFKDLFTGLAWLASHYQDTDREIAALGKDFTINPSKWKINHTTKAMVGLGAGDNTKMVESLQGLLMLQERFIQEGFMLTDQEKIYNTMKRIVDGLGLPNADEFLNNPNEPDSLLRAQNEKLNQTVLVLQQQLQQLAQQVDNPLAEAEQIKQQANLIKAQSDSEIKIAQLQEEQRQFNAKMIAEQEQKMNELALKLTELEQQYNKQLNQEFDDNKGE